MNAIIDGEVPNIFVAIMRINSKFMKPKEKKNIQNLMVCCNENKEKNCIDLNIENFKVNK